MYKYALLLWFSRYFVDVLTSQKVYHIKEETEIGYVVDYVKSNGLKPIRIFNINDTGVQCFNLDSNSGKLFVAKRIDREHLCQSDRTKLYGTKQCEIVIKLAYEVFNIVEKVIITVEDINDNEPSWKKDSITLNFNENDQIGGRRSLPEATDIDIEQNSQISYRLESKYRNFFRLHQDNGLYLENIQSLDREKQDIYELILVAQDNGVPARSNQLKIVVEVNDINDNSPKFTKSVFRPDKLVPETVEIKTVVLTLTAEDPDAGRNGKFSFAISPNVGGDVLKYFSVKENGDVVIQSAIDYDSGQHKFEFKVQVEDNAVHPYSRSSEAVVDIDIQDVNDHYPELLFYAMKLAPQNGHPSIDENLPIMSPIGQLTVKDVDFKGQDKVSCEVGTTETNKPNTINLMSTNEAYEFQVVSNRKFDREQQQEVYAEILCTDSANHVTKKNLTIVINDVNDHAPTFSKNIFHVFISENQPIGAAVSPRILVTDSDTGDNGIFQLSIEAPDDKLFTIDQKDQILRSNVIFDRESISQYRLKIIAVDSGSIRLTSSCHVYVHIRDVNDNRVVLSSSSYTFHVQENNKPRTVIGTIKATDHDNQTIVYTIDPPSQARFYVEKYSGNIIVQKSLDREDENVHHVIVIASDGIHSATATVTVLVDDINDNAPIFTSPNHSNKVIKMDIKETPGYRIGTITATDRDFGDNGSVKYSLKKKDHKQYWFNLDADTGDLYLATSLHSPRIPDSSIYLDVEACDQGLPRLCTVLSSLEIRWNSPGQNQVNQESVATKPFSIESFLNEYVLILAISGLLMFMIIIMVVFVIIKQKSDIFNRRRPTTNSSNVKKSLMCYQESFGSPDYRCSTELENLDNDMKHNSDMRSTPALQCSSIYFADSKLKHDSTQFRCESAPNNIMPIFEDNHNPIDTKKATLSSNDNYYSKYMTDRYCKISNTDKSIQQMESDSFNKIRNSKNHSSFV